MALMVILISLSIVAFVAIGLVIAGKLAMFLHKRAQSVALKGRFAEQ